MPTPTFIILADRGLLKAFSIEQTAARGPMPRLIETLQISDAHGRFEDKVSDQAGSFPTGGTAGQGNSIAEKMNLGAEMESRIFRQLSGHITNLLRQHQPASWAFAAPSEINSAILGGVAPELQASLTRNIPRDLVNLPPSDLLRHFDLPND